MIVIQVSDKYENASWLTSGSLNSESVTKVATPMIQSNIWSETELSFVFANLISVMIKQTVETRTDGVKRYLPICTPFLKYAPWAKMSIR